MYSAIWSRLFGNSTGRRVALRCFADFLTANAVLVAAGVLRVVVSGQLDLADPVGHVMMKCNPVYILHASWFAATAVLLFAVAGLYRPVPSSRIGQRLINVTGACAIGFAGHLALGGVVEDRLAATLEVAVPAWTLLGMTVFATRFSSMSILKRFRVVRRHTAAGNGKVEDVLVVGGAGYIGSVLTEQLLRKGYRVRILDMELFGRDSLRTILHHPRLEFMKGDFRNIEDVVRALHDMDAVIHLAAIVGDPACALDRDTTIAVNYAAAKMMAQLARANGIARFVFASTCSVYGESEEIRTEESDLNPVSLYATTKIDAERALLEAADAVLQPTILRFATAYGWSLRPRFDLVANLFSAQAVTENHIRVLNGEQWRPFVHTRDIARACVLAVEAQLTKVGGEIFNVGDHTQNFTLQQLGQIVGTCQPGPFVEEIRNNDDARNYRVDFSKIQRVLGFRASVSLEDGVREMVEAVRDGKVTDWRDPVYSNVRTLQGAGLNILKFDPDSGKGHNELQATKEFLSRAA
ncbi:MAG: NAD(P)-dependent oxidoreductase [Planctomycetota bacterium]|nr:NAD(P)-dependent oxidoreductase [Planctomycetota bacterium]